MSKHTYHAIFTIVDKHIAFDIIKTKNQITFDNILDE